MSADMGDGLSKKKKERQEQSEEDEDDLLKGELFKSRFKCTYAKLMKELASIEDSCCRSFITRPHLLE